MAIITSGNLIITHVPEYYSFSNISQLRTSSVSQQTNGNTVNVEGYYTTSDDGEGLFTFNSASTLTDDGGYVIRPSNIGSGSAGRWIRQFTGQDANVEMWGAKGDGVFDDQPYIQNAINYCSYSSVSSLNFGAKTYALTSWALRPANVNISYGDAQLYVGWGPPPGDLWGGQSVFTTTPVSGSKPAELVFRGRGANLTKIMGLSGFQDHRNNDMIAFYERVRSLAFYDLTLERQLSAQKIDTGFNNLIGGHSNWGNGNRAPWGIKGVGYDLGTALLAFTGVNFVEGHRAFTIERGFVPYGLRKLVVNKCNFIYPCGANQFDPNSAPGNQMFNMSSEVEYAEYIDCMFKGSETVPALSPNYFPKDGAHNYSGRNSITRNCTAMNCHVENFYVGYHREPALLEMRSWDTPIFKPAVGGSITFTVSSVARGYFTTSYNVGDYITLAKPFDFSNPNGLGTYQITTSSEGPEGNLGARNYTLTCRRVSGSEIDDPIGYLNTDMIRMSAGQRFVTGSFAYLIPTNQDRTLNVSVSVVDCTFVGGDAVLIPNSAVAVSLYSGLCAQPACSPAIRILNGAAVVKNNRFLGAYGLIDEPNVGSSNYTNTRFENNYIEVRGYGNDEPLRYVPGYQQSYFNGTQGDFIGVGSVINNNNYVFWQNGSVRNGWPQNTTGLPASPPPNWWVGIQYNAAGIGYNQTITNNKFMINVPLSASMILEMYSQFGSGTNTDWCGNGDFKWCIPLNTTRNNNWMIFENIGLIRNLSAIRLYDGSYPNTFSTRMDYVILSAYITGYNSTNDGGQGWYKFDKNSSTTENSTTVIRPVFISSGNPGRWLRQ